MPSGNGKKRRVIDCIIPDKRRCPEPNSIETLRYVITNFQKDVAVAKQRDAIWMIELPKLEAHGYQWGGSLHEDEAKMMFALNLEDEGVEIAYYPTFRMYTSRITVISDKEFECGQTIVEGEPAEVFNLDIINDFILEVDIEFLRLERHVWFPKKIPREETLVKLLDCKETSDVTFVVEGRSFDLHKSVLFLKCKKLFEIANESVESEDAHAIPIQSIKCLVFDALIDFIYTKKIPWLNHEEMKELLVAADRFECIDLKLYTESILVFNNFRASAPATELLIFANSYSCALLWEAATRHYTLNRETMKKSEAWSRVKESSQLLEELLDDSISIINRRNSVGDDNNDDKEIEMMTVADLRNELQDAGLALDGSRGILVNRLETYRKTIKADWNDNHNGEEQDDTDNS